MEDNKKGGFSRQGRRDYDKNSTGRPQRKHFTTRKPVSGAEKVWSADRSYSTDRPFSEERPRRFSDKPRTERSYGERAYGERSHGDRPYGDRPRTDRPRTERSRSERPYGERQYGDKPYAKKYPSARKPRQDRGAGASSGINAMINRKPKVENVAFSDNDTVKTPVQEIVRLNKYIANSGVCSRREADTLIQSGVVTVNGEVVTELGTKVNILMDDVRFNGERLKGEEKVYIVMNKPKGYVTTAGDPHAEKTVMDLIKGCPVRVFPVGRLDKNTTGVLMFTNDGEMAERLTHPSYNKKKIYQVVVDHNLSQEDKDKVLAGIELGDGVIAADELEYVDEHDHRKLGIEIHSGKNRIVRRIFESLGYDVKALDRVYFAGLTKKGLKKGDWRFLTEGEVNILKMGAYV